MNADKKYSPYDLPGTFRAYAYDAVVLAWEAQRVDIISTKFDKKILHSACELDVSILKTSDEVMRHDLATWPTNEFLISLRNNSGYKGLFKRLRDTFAHGHYGINEQGWITIRHRYQSKTRIFGNLQISTFKKLIVFLDKSNSGTV